MMIVLINWEQIAYDVSKTKRVTLHSVFSTSQLVFIFFISFILISTLPHSYKNEPVEFYKLHFLVVILTCTCQCFVFY